MDRQHVTRRIVLSVAVVGLAVLTALGGGDAVNAESTKAPADLYASKAEFKSYCEANPGATFIDVPSDNLTVCAHKDGSKTSCDQKGQNCYSHPPKREETDGPLLGTKGEIITEILPMEPAPTVQETLIGGGVLVEDVEVGTDETQAVAPVYAPLEVIAEASLEAVARAVGCRASSTGRGARHPDRGNPWPLKSQ